MKIFLDTGDVKAIRRVHETGLLDGVTTNPSNIAETGRPFEEVAREICSITPGPVSVEAMSETRDELIEECQRLAGLAPNVVVKIPVTAEGLAATKILESEKGVPINVTMAFSPTQALMAMKAGASYVSIVLSRLDACANESHLLIEDTVQIKELYGFQTDIIAGSVKTQNHLLACLRAGLDIATIPEALFNQMFYHPLTDVAIAQFKKDWGTVPEK